MKLCYKIISEHILSKLRVLGISSVSLVTLEPKFMKYMKIKKIAKLLSVPKTILKIIHPLKLQKNIYRPV